MISSKAIQIKNRLLEFCSLMTLQYNGVEFDIDPFNQQLFHICYNGNEWEAHSIEEVMNNPFISGRCLNDIAEEIEVIDW